MLIRELGFNSLEFLMIAAKKGRGQNFYAWKQLICRLVYGTKLSRVEQGSTYQIVQFMALNVFFFYINFKLRWHEQLFVLRFMTPCLLWGKPIVLLVEC